MQHREHIPAAGPVARPADSGTDAPAETAAHAIGILAISGSLRARSSNAELLRAVSLLAPTNVRVTMFSGLDALPHFNPDLDADPSRLPPAVGDFRRRVRTADALLICSPEYAHGVPGSLKNALDWLVSVPDLTGKPVGLLNASPRATHAPASLAETLRTMALAVVPDASIAVPVQGRFLGAAAMAREPELAATLRGVIAALTRAARAYRVRAIPQADGAA